MICEPGKYNINVDAKYKIKLIYHSLKWGNKKYTIYKFQFFYYYLFLLIYKVTRSDKMESLKTGPLFG